MNRTITSNEIEFIILKLPTNKSPGPDSFWCEFCQTFREELAIIFLKLVQKIAEEGILSNSSYETPITLITKPDKGITKKRKL